MDNSQLKKLIQEQLPEGVDFDTLIENMMGNFSTMPVEERDAILSQEVPEAELAVRSLLAREDSPEGFANFCWCITGMELPAHAYYAWIIPKYFAHGNITLEQMEEYYKAPEAKPFQYVIRAARESRRELIGDVIYAAREMAKTTYNTVLFMAFRIGLEPWKANMIVQIGDNSAKRNAQKVADIIDQYSGWKAVFPNVRPNKENSWSANGYEVVDTSKTQLEWEELNATRQDVSLAGYGYNSGVIIGKHPDGYLVIDDIHNETNTQSQVELDKTIQIVQGTIFYAMTDSSWVTFVGTPWIDGDTLDFVSRTGEYFTVKTPAFFDVINGEYKIADKWVDNTEKVYLWPEIRGERWVMRKQRTTIPSEFKRMVLLTLSMGELRLYTYSQYPEEKIDWSWPQRTGVDPTGVVTLVQGIEAGVSNFAMAHALLTPTRQIVIADGTVEKIDLEEGERRVVRHQRMYPSSSFWIETNNAGAAFISIINRTPGVNWNGVHTSEIGSGSKEQRQYNFLQPLLKNNVIVISSAQSRFLDMARNYLNKFGLFKFNSDAPELDVGDAIVLAVWAFPEIWMNYVSSPVNPSEFGRLRIDQEVPKAFDPIQDVVSALNRR